MSRKKDNKEDLTEGSHKQQKQGGEQNTAHKHSSHHRSKTRVGFLARIRNYLLAGTLVTAPFAITVYLSWLFIDFVDGLIPASYHPSHLLPPEYQVPGLGFLFVILGLVLIGATTTVYLGRSLVRNAEYFLGRTPVVRSIYGAIKQILETVMASKSTAFRQVVLVEYPRRGIWAIGFVSGATTGEVQNVTSKRMINVFLPTTPNPTSGFLLFVPEEDLYVLNMSVEDGIKMVVSGGLVTPPDPRSVEEQNKPAIQ